MITFFYFTLSSSLHCVHAKSINVEDSLKPPPPGLKGIALQTKFVGSLCYANMFSSLEKSKVGS